MKFSLAWIREFVRADGAPEELAARLTSAGLVVETVTQDPSGDAILDIEIFSNRPDCMNVYGVARELAAVTGTDLCPYPATVEEKREAPPATELARLEVEAGDLCGRYDARVMQGVRIGPSPDWLTRRLATAGLRPVNNVVDATNYVLWELGHPLHAFDLETLGGRQIRVRVARRGESITTLDGVHRALDPEVLVIADKNRPVAIAGVMGGAATMVSERTTSLLLESAHFEPTRVRRAARRLGLSTDASYRFERGADMEATVVALNRVASLIQQTAGGWICPGVLECRAAPPAVRRIRLRAARVSALLGISVTPDTIQRALTALHFAVSSRQDGFEVEVPSYRQDVDREVDLIEEVARIIGYDAIPGRLPHIAGSGGIHRAGNKREAAIRRVLEAGGCHEANTTSFGSASLDWGLRQRLDATEPAIEPIALANPLSAEQEILRTTLLPGLLEAVARNLNHGARDVRLYEIGRTFRRGVAVPPPHEDRKHPPAGPVDERLMLGIVLTGHVRPRHWMEPPREVSLFDVKGLLQTALAEAGLESDVERLGGSEALDVGRSAALTTGGRRLARMGELKADWMDRFGIRQPVWVAEASLADVFQQPERAVAFTPLARYPSVSRDLSLVVSVDRSYHEIENTVRRVAPETIARVSALDRYTGEGVPPGMVGLTINVLYQHPERTLSSEEVAGIQERIVEALASELGASLRTQR